MPRRASTSVHPLWIVAVLVFVTAAIGGGYFLKQRVADPYRTVAGFDVAAYLENANSLRGNTYKLTGTIVNSLAWSPGSGRLFSVEVAKSSASPDLVPVLVPVQFNKVNIQKGQRFLFKVEVDEKGILKVQELRKV